MAEVAEPLGMFYAVEGGVLGGAAEGGGFGGGEGLELLLTLGCELETDLCLKVVWTDELAAVAAEGIS